MEEKVNQPQQNNPENVFIDVKKAKKKRRLSKTGKIVFSSFGFFLILIVAFYLYFQSDYAKVKSIKVIGNQLLAKDYIIQLSEIDQQDRILFLFPEFRAKKMCKDALLDEVHISLGENQSVVIEVIENKIVGYEVKEQTKLILKDGTLIDFKANYIKNLALLPLFVEVQTENIETVAQSLALIDDGVLYRISEIHQTSFTYDANMLKLTMDDGYYIYSSINGLKYINSYLELLVNQKNSNNKCFLILDEYHSAVNTDCQAIEAYQKAPENDGA